MSASSTSIVDRLRPLLQLIAPQRRALGYAAMSGVAQQLVALGIAAGAAWLVGRSLAGASASTLRAGVIALALASVPVALLPWLESFCSHVAAFRILADLRGRVYDALERLAPAFLLARRSGELGATAIADVELLERCFAHMLSPIVVAASLPLIAIVALGRLHLWLALALLPTLALLLTVPLWLRRSALQQGDVIRARLGALSADAVDLVQGLRELLAFGGEAGQLRRLAAHGTALREAKLAHARRAGMELAATDALIALGSLAVLMVAGHLVREGALAASWLPVALLLAATSLLPLSAVLDVLRELNLAAAAAERVTAILTAQPTVIERESVEEIEPLEPTVRFEHVSFRYADERPWAIDGLSLELAAGETLALVGHSGAGKSTLINLLQRIYDVADGRITIGGRDVRSLTSETLRALVTSVPQDVYLFHTSLRENIRLGAPHADDAAVVAAARAAFIHERICELPQGYDTQAGELGARLSGGERQRIAIARALLRNAPILVLDEAVSNLDGVNEDAIGAAIAQLRRGRTTLIIAHRFSTIRSADRVAVLERGKLVEQGSHAELAARGAAYTGLMASQWSVAAAPRRSADDDANEGEFQ